MFDVGFSELGVIGLVALIVIGPEQLPRVARTAGHLMGRLRRYVSDVKSDISREMELADLNRLRDEVQTSAAAFESSIRQQVAGIEAEVQQSIASPELHELAHVPVAEAHAEVSEPVVVPPTEATVSEAPVADSEESVDPNQMDLFGAPLVPPTELPQKH